MDDMFLIDCVEKIRSHCLAQAPELGERLERLRAGDYSQQPDSFFKVRLVAVALRIDDSVPAGRRSLRRELARGEMAQFFSKEELRDAVGEEAGAYAPASPEVRELLARSLEAFGRGEPFARRLGREPGLPAAAALVTRELPVLRGRLVYEYLIECGYPAAVPAAESMRFFHRLGLLGDTAGGGSAAAARRSFFSTVERLARQARISLGEMDLLLGLFSGARREKLVEPVCAKVPRCGVCTLSAYCSFFRYQPPAKPPLPYRSIKEWAVDERPRERLLAGGQLSNAELLAIILRTGSGKRSALDLARELLASFSNSLHRLASAAPEEVLKLPGIGPAKLAEIRAALELGRRAAHPESDERDGLRAVTSSRDVFDYFRPRYKNATQEEFLLLTLNTKNRITREVTVSLGTLNSSIVHPRDVFKAALTEAAAAVIFVHNHPSGDPAPSREDKTLTTRLAEAGRLLGIKVLDHVIIGATRYYSFADEGELS